MNQCTLCKQSISDAVYLGKKPFCCFGCETVYTILSKKTELDNVLKHPLFLQSAKSGIISNPKLLEQIESKDLESSDTFSEKLYFEIKGLWCPSCAEVCRLSLQKLTGVKNCSVDYTTDLAAVEYFPKFIGKERLFATIARFGYEPKEFQDLKGTAENRSLLFRFIIAAFFSMNIMMFSYPIYVNIFFHNEYNGLFKWLSFLATLPILFYSARPIFAKCFRALYLGLFGQETLVFVSVISAFCVSLFALYKEKDHVYFDSMSVMITFVLLGKLIESKAKVSTKKTLFRMTQCVPKKGRVRLAGNQESFVSLKDVKIGDHLICLGGEKVVLDGVVVEGVGFCDESLMTGEVKPVKKREGEKVLCGTILTKGRIVYRARKSEKETALRQMIDCIANELVSKSSSYRVVDPFLRIFVPAVIAIAFGTAFGLLLLGKNTEVVFLRAMSCLLISCPCALGIAAPLAESQLLNALATIGAIVRNRGCLKHLGSEDVIIFDKTGTITEGVYQVLSGLHELPREEKSVLKAMVSQSIHPISRALDSKISDPACSLYNYQEVLGKGLLAYRGQERYLLGSKKFLKSFSILFCDRVDQELSLANSEVYFAKESQLIARIVLGDRLRDQAECVVKALKPKRVVLLSGDALRSVEMIGKKCLFDEWRAEVLPLEKKEFVEAVKQEGRVVCMIGDGINDAPALASAEVGISCVTATALSEQASDIMLTKANLTILPELFALAKKGKRVALQNLFWAFSYNIFGIALAVYGLLTPLMSAIAMVVSSLVVIFNALRIRPKV